MWDIYKWGERWGRYAVTGGEKQHMKRAETGGAEVKRRSREWRIGEKRRAAACGLAQAAASACQKSLAEFVARRRQKNEIIFSRDMCVRENTAQAASVEFRRITPKLCAQQAASLLSEKTGGFFDTFKPPPAFWRRQRHI